MNNHDFIKSKFYFSENEEVVEIDNKQIGFRNNPANIWKSF